MNVYDHEDAFKNANLCAGSRVKLASALGTAQDRDTARLIIQHAQVEYSNLFEAFIEGVAWGRENPEWKLGKRVWLKEDMRKYVKPTEPGWTEYAEVASHESNQGGSDGV